MELYRTIRVVRKRRKLTQKDLCALVGITQTYLSQIEAGDKRPSPELLLRISTALGLPLPLLIWESLTIEDVVPGKEQLFRELHPYITSMLKLIFVEHADDTREDTKPIKRKG